jgi:hypothetical protein
MGSIVYDFYDESEDLLWNLIKPKPKINIKTNCATFYCGIMVLSSCEIFIPTGYQLELGRGISTIVIEWFYRRSCAGWN